jgi:hypothetical protein
MEFYRSVSEFTMPTHERRFFLRPALSLAGVFSALLAISGCVSAASGTESSEPDIGKPLTTLSTKDLRLPLESYLPTAGQVREFDRARLVLVDRCMQRFAFSYKVDVPAVEGSTDSNSRRYGITDSSLAAKKGYGLATDAEAHPATPELGADEQTVLYGEGASSLDGRAVPEGGCLGEASRGLDAHSPKGADFTLTQQLAFTSFKQAQEDSRVRKVVKAWSDCMAEQGYHYANPLAPLSDPKLGDGTGADAIRTARVDLDCKTRTNLVGVSFTVESAYQQRLIKQSAELVKATKEARDARLRVADSLV